MSSILSTPTALLFKLLNNAHPPSFATLLNVIIAYLACEALFLAFSFWVRASASSNLSTPPPYPCEKRAFISRILSRLERTHPKNKRKAICDFLSGWCQGAPIEDIRQGNIVEFLAWAMYASRPSELSDKDLAEISTFFTRLEKEHDIFMEHGHNPEVKACKVRPASREAATFEAVSLTRRFARRSFP